MSTSRAAPRSSSSSLVSACSRWARPRRGGGCRRSRRRPSGFFSTISCAIRTSVRRMSSRSRTTVLDSQRAPSWPHGTGLKGPTRWRVTVGTADQARSRPGPVEHVREPDGDDVAVEGSIPAFSITRHEATLSGGVGDHAIEPEHVERGLDRGAGEFGGQALAPAVGMRCPRRSRLRRTPLAVVCLSPPRPTSCPLARSRSSQSPKPWRSQWSIVAGQLDDDVRTSGRVRVIPGVRSTRMQHQHGQLVGVLRAWTLADQSLGDDAVEVGH